MSNRSAALFVAILIFLILLLRPMDAAGHGEYAWIMDHKSSYGASCCGPKDAVSIPHEVAAPLEVGSRVTVEFHGLTVDVVVNTIYPTEDPEGRAWITRYGCLFKIFGV